MAVVELAIALEAGVGRYLRDFFLQQGISDENFEELMREVGMYRALRTLLPVACPATLPGDSVASCRGMLTIRNKVMHQARTEIEEIEVEKFSEAVEAVLDHLDKNPPVKGGGR